MAPAIRLARIYALALIAVATIFAASASAQNAPKYDPSTETKIQGVIEDLKYEPQGKVKEMVHLVMKNGDQTVDIYLCPKSFMEEMGVSYSKGDQISFTGSKVKQGDAELILAREVVKGEDTLVVRDGKGNPVWTH